MPSPTDLIGTWTLLSFAFYTSSSCTSLHSHPLGPHALGRLTFSSDGYMNAFLSNPDIATPLSVPWMAAPETDIGRVARVQAGYCGRYTVYEEGGESRFATEVEMAFDPGLVGRRMVRRWGVEDVEGRRCLVLRPVEGFVLSDGGQAFAELRWVKVELDSDAKS
ncbi:uncharacterized protein LY89DRAFT_672134 [Mollisia scopiformis]|uniref:Lipocalin-like domain-containing protein n=1 Tax=Mollisia scopiformis TaxID=149040 RepID=A0A194X0Y9_MOLSC|nr:uncharacterized protein LY89DRAFT_672134 [Mollisia scopiformis]KUJ13858.1 hypothetical protein LY89DRAFT_672134 [Mollisia scopiformis]